MVADILVATEKENTGTLYVEIFGDAVIPQATKGPDRPTCPLNARKVQEHKDLQAHDKRAQNSKSMLARNFIAVACN